MGITILLVCQVVMALPRLLNQAQPSPRSLVLSLHRSLVLLLHRLTVVVIGSPERRLSMVETQVVAHAVTMIFLR